MEPTPRRKNLLASVSGVSSPFPDEQTTSILPDERLMPEVRGIIRLMIGLSAGSYRFNRC